MEGENQTAVEWLMDKIKSSSMCDHIKGVEYWDKETLLEFLETALKMEQQHLEKIEGKTKCDNCGEVVKMVSTGEFCPACMC
jgi:rubrerythrin